MPKKIEFKRQGRPASGDAWVKGVAVSMKRFSFDIPVELHKRIKRACAERGVTMISEIIELLNTAYPDTAKRAKK